jgi:integrase
MSGVRVPHRPLVGEPSKFKAFGSSRQLLKVCLRVYLPQKIGVLGLFGCCDNPDFVPERLPQMAKIEINAPAITVENDRGKLRLRWRYQGKPYRLSTGLNADPMGKSAASVKVAQIRGDMASGNFDPTLLKYRPRLLGKNPSEISYPKLFEQYLKTMQTEKALAPGSLRRYSGVGFHLGQSLDVPAHRVGATQAANFAAVLQEKVCNDTAKGYLWALQSCWQWAQGRYHVGDENPWPAQVRRIKPQPKQRVQPFTVVEARAILTAFKTDQTYAHYADFVVFLFGVGCRFGESVGLRWRHVGPDFTTAWVGESISRGHQKGTKTGKARTIHLPDSVAAMLRERHQRLTPFSDSLVFPAPGGGPINDNNFSRRAWRSVLDQLGIEYRRVYTVRHTQISHALAAGVNPIALSEQTGHNKRVLLDTYAHVIDQKPLFVEF